ncbi:hypothetical protein MAR_000346, partial [Mya arenaria]
GVQKSGPGSHAVAEGGHGGDAHVQRPPDEAVLPLLVSNALSGIHMFGKSQYRKLSSFFLSRKRRELTDCRIWNTTNARSHIAFASTDRTSVNSFNVAAETKSGKYKNTYSPRSGRESGNLSRKKARTASGVSSVLKISKGMKRVHLQISLSDRRYLVCFAVRNGPARSVQIVYHTGVHGYPRGYHDVLQSDPSKRLSPARGQRQIDASAAHHLHIPDVLSHFVGPAVSEDKAPLDRPKQNGTTKTSNPSDSKQISSTDSNANRADSQTNNPVPRSVAFTLDLDGKETNNALLGPPPPRLKRLDPLNVPKLTANELAEKQRLADEKRESVKKLNDLDQELDIEVEKDEDYNADEVDSWLDGDNNNNNNDSLHSADSDEKIYNGRSSPQKQIKSEKRGLNRGISANTIDSFDNAYNRKQPGASQNAEIKDDFFDT